MTTISFVEELEEIVGKTVSATWTGCYPQLLLLFTDGTAALIEEGYLGEHGGMTVRYPPEEYHRRQAEEVLNALEMKRRPRDFTL